MAVVSVSSGISLAMLKSTCHTPAEVGCCRRPYTLPYPYPYTLPYVVGYMLDPESNLETHTRLKVFFSSEPRVFMKVVKENTYGGLLVYRDCLLTKEHASDQGWFGDYDGHCVQLTLALVVLSAYFHFDASRRAVMTFSDVTSAP